MKKFKKFLKSMAEELGEPIPEINTDTPTCPNCGSTMEFHGGDLDYGDGYWDCSSCGYTFTEDDLEEFL